jgi:hypothetical protein
MQRYDDPFLPFGKRIIDATHDLICGYIFDLAAYLALGAAGLVALERTIAYAGEEVVTILHGPFASSDYAEAAGATALNVDAVTITNIADAEIYLQSGVGVFITEGGIGENGRLTLGDVTLNLLDQYIFYAGRGDDFADAVRTAVKARLR